MFHLPKVFQALLGLYIQFFPGALRGPECFIFLRFSKLSGAYIPPKNPGALRAPECLLLLRFPRFWGQDRTTGLGRRAQAGLSSNLGLFDLITFLFNYFLFNHCAARRPAEKDKTAIFFIQLFFYLIIWLILVEGR